MLGKIAATLSSMLGASPVANAQTVKSPVDLNQPVENPALVAAMDRVAREPSDSSKDALLKELQQANYLAAMLTDGMKTSTNSLGQVTIEKGSKFGVLTAGKDGKNFLVLFTDWRALRAYTQLEVSGWVLPAKDAWLFALEGNSYEGVVINPSHNALPLARPMLEYLSKGKYP